ncbi:hypothetical protein HGB24_03495 [Candidatus Saccharibacteria bacterium]|nr:hypothetical protein [Candidatus Saccharibacteria bacterium]
MSVLSFSKDCNQNGYYYLSIKVDDVDLGEDDYRYLDKLLAVNLLRNPSVEVAAFSFMTNSLEMILIQHIAGGVESFWNDVFKKFEGYLKSKGSLDADLDKAASIKNISDENLLEMSRRIHSLCDDDRNDQYSSLRAFLYDDVPVWLNKRYIASQYKSAEKYAELIKS